MKLILLRCYAKNQNGENENLIFFRRNKDAQGKIDLSSNFFFLFALTTSIIKTSEKVNLKKILRKKIFIKSDLLKKN